jgi:hypothetical protein
VARWPVATIGSFTGLAAGAAWSVWIGIRGCAAHIHTCSTDGADAGRVRDLKPKPCIDRLSQRDMARFVHHIVTQNVDALHRRAGASRPRVAGAWARAWQADARAVL